MGNIGLIDADLLDKGTNFPNLVIMKLSSYYKKLGDKVTLLDNYNNINKYDKVLISKVFDYTKIPINIDDFSNIEIGGTGFFFDKSPKLIEEIEHIMPDYTIYDLMLPMIKNTEAYINYSIGFATRGCFRKCSFCVNRNYDRAEIASNLKEFVDEDKKYICLLDDNFFAFSGWKNIMLELIAIGKPIQFKQGLDIRLLTAEKAEYLSKCRYKGEYIFAFDNYEDRELIEDKLKLWRTYLKPNKRAGLFYLLLGYAKQNEEEVIECFERIRILSKYKALPYIMRHNNYLNTEWEKLFIYIANWANQPSLFTKMSFKEYSVLKGMGTKYKEYRNNWEKYIEDGNNKHISWRITEKFEKQFPEIANKYFYNCYFTGEVFKYGKI